MVKRSNLRPMTGGSVTSGGGGSTRPPTLPDEQNQQGRNGNNRNRRNGSGSNGGKTVNRDQLRPVDSPQRSGGNRGQGGQSQGRQSGSGGSRSQGRNRETAGEQVGPAPAEGEPRRLGPNRWLDASGTEWSSREQAQNANERNENGGAPPAFGSTRDEEVVENSPTENLAEGMDQFYDAVFPNPETERAGGAATGATFGGYIGSALGPLGTVAGSAIGAGIGSSAVYAKQTFFDEEVNPSTRDIAEDTANTMANDALWTMGFMTAGPLVSETMSRFLRQKDLRGAMPEQVRQAKEAADGLRGLGFEMSPVETARASWARDVPNVTGLIPFGGGSAVRRQAGQSEENLENLLRRDVDRILEEDLNSGPTASLNALGVNVLSSARNSNQSWRNIVRQQYKAFDELAREKGEQAKADFRGPRHAATNALRQTHISDPNMRRTLDELKQEHRHWNLVDHISRGKAETSVRQLREQQKRINLAMKEVGRSKETQELSNALKQIKSETEESLQRVQDPELNNMITHANRTFAYVNDLFKNSKAAAEFQRADPDAFRKRGFSDAVDTLPEDQVARNLMQTNSPQTVRSLKEIVGNRRTRQIGAKLVQDALDSSRSRLDDGRDVIDWMKFRENLGLDDQAKRETLGEFFENSRFGQKVQDRQRAMEAAHELGPGSDEANEMLKQFDRLDNQIENKSLRLSDQDLSQESNQFLRTLDNVTMVGRNLSEINVRDPSTFLARRLTLSGTGALGAAGIGQQAAGYTGGYLQSYIALIALSNAGHQALSSPKLQRPLNRALEGVHARNPRTGQPETRATEGVHIGDHLGERVGMEDRFWNRAGGLSEKKVNTGRERQAAMGTFWKEMSPSVRIDAFGNLTPLMSRLLGENPDDLVNQDNAMDRFQREYNRRQREAIERNQEQREQNEPPELRGPAFN